MTFIIDVKTQCRITEFQWNISCAQVKIWFQNRRMKWKRSKKPSSEKKDSNKKDCCSGSANNKSSGNNNNNNSVSGGTSPSSSPSFDDVNSSLVVDTSNAECLSDESDEEEIDVQHDDDTLNDSSGETKLELSDVNLPSTLACISVSAVDNVPPGMKPNLVFGVRNNLGGALNMVHNINIISSLNTNNNNPNNLPLVSEEDHFIPQNPTIPPTSISLSQSSQPCHVPASALAPNPAVSLVQQTQPNVLQQLSQPVQTSPALLTTNCSLTPVIHSPNAALTPLVRLGPRDQVPLGPTDQIPLGPRCQIPLGPGDQIPLGPRDQIPLAPRCQAPLGPIDQVTLLPRDPANVGPINQVPQATEMDSASDLVKRLSKKGSKGLVKGNKIVSDVKTSSNEVLSTMVPTSLAIQRSDFTAITVTGQDGEQLYRPYVA